ncbi:UspA domain-containing protein [Oscillatoriales cyanobacterium USR001]|nr:UspA domain-containing protein [Oscillatoriales cyanobacterium USR001]
MSFHKIFAALDETELSHQVFAQALDMAVANKAEMMLFYGITVNQLGERGMPIPVELGMNIELADQAYQAQSLKIEHNLEHGHELLKNYYDAAEKREIKPEFDARMVEDVGQAICEAAKSWGADLIVLGRRGRTGLAEAILGSVSNHVVHHASCCVLVIQPPE